MTLSLARRLALFLVLTMLLLWPGIRFGQPAIFTDSESYYRGGGVAIEFALRKAGLAESPAAAPAAAGAGEPAAAGADVVEAELEEARGLRSVPFSVLINVLTRVFGLFGLPVVFALLGAWLMLSYCRHLSFAMQVAATLATAALTTVPYYTVYFMPDLFAGLIILAALVLVAHPGLPGWQRWLLLLVALGGGIAHYAHIPLVAVLGFCLGVVFLVRGERLWALAAQLPLAGTVAINLAISLMVPAGPEGEAAPSLTPARYPFLLARIIDDGPGLAYLRENCATSDFTICKVYDEGQIPTNVQAILWGPESIQNVATVEQFSRIREEELDFVWEVFRQYPAEQVWHFAMLSIRQFFMFDLLQVYFDELEVESATELNVGESVPGAGEVQDFSEVVQIAALGLAAVGLVLGLVFGNGRQRWVVAVLLVALAANAAICGGLSAPAGRYQGRVVWVAALVGFALLAELARRPRGRLRDARA